MSDYAWMEPEEFLVVAKAALGGTTDPVIQGLLARYQGALDYIAELEQEAHHGDDP